MGCVKAPAGHYYIISLSGALTPGLCFGVINGRIRMLYIIVGMYEG